MSGGVRLAYRVGNRTLIARTCCTCGEFKMRSEFHNRSNGAAQAVCKACAIKAGTEYNWYRNKESEETASRATAPWTKAEVRKLSQLVERGVPIRQIAYQMGRSIPSIDQARKKLRRSAS